MKEIKKVKNTLTITLLLLIILVSLLSKSCVGYKEPSFILPTVDLEHVDFGTEYKNVLISGIERKMYHVGDTVQMAWVRKVNYSTNSYTTKDTFWIYSKYDKNNHLVKSPGNGITLFPTIIIKK